MVTFTCLTTVKNLEKRIEVCESHLQVGQRSRIFALLTLHPPYRSCLGREVSGYVMDLLKSDASTLPPGLLTPCSLLGPLSHSDLPSNLDAPALLYQV